MDIENTIKIMLKGAADHTDVEEIREKLKKVDAEHRPLRIKLGLDPSAPDIHLGHAVVLRKIKQLQDLHFTPFMSLFFSCILYAFCNALSIILFFIKILTFFL